MIFVGFIVVGFFVLKDCLFSAENLLQKGFNHTRENTMKLYLQTVLVHLVTVSKHV